MNRFFRDLHSLKGSARYLEFRALAAEVHEAEEVLADIRDGRRQATSGAKEEIRSMLGRLFESVERIGLVNEKFQAFAGKTPSGPASGSGFFDSLKIMVDGIAKDLGKEAGLSVRHDAPDIPYLQVIKNPLIHLIRNALDHGIEAPIERLGAGKPAAGSIRLSTRKAEDGSYLIVLTDDGRGIDFDRVEKQAREKGLLKQGEKQITKTRLVNFLFQPNFSSKSEVSELSGRGVGLDVVYRSVSEAGGRIAVESGKNIGTRITLRLPPAGQKEL